MWITTTLVKEHLYFWKTADFVSFLVFSASKYAASIASVVLNEHTTTQYSVEKKFGISGTSVVYVPR